MIIDRKYNGISQNEIENISNMTNFELSNNIDNKMIEIKKSVNFIEIMHNNYVDNLEIEIDKLGWKFLNYMLKQIHKEIDIDTDIYTGEIGYGVSLQEILEMSYDELKADIILFNKDYK